MNNLTEHPTHILVGSHAQTEDYILDVLREQLGGPITDKQHHALLWIEPEKQYTVDTLKPVFHTTSFALEDNANFFIILHKADLLTQTTANSILKLIEEPPAGYIFILTTQHKDTMLPTILSRSMVHYLAQDSSSHHHPLLNFFKEPSANFIEFQACLDEHKPNEIETVDLIERLLHLLYQKPPTDAAAQKTIKLLHEALAYPPMPGSGKLFWKNLFLRNLP